MFNQLFQRSTDSMSKNMNALAIHAKNVDNIFTTGYKTEQVTFQDTLRGLKTSTGRDFSTGTAKKTNRELDFSIQGAGFFEIQMPDGSLAYTRDGSFGVNEVGELVTRQGYRVTNKEAITAEDINKTFDALGQKVDAGTFNLSISSQSLVIPTGSDISLAEDGTLQDSSANNIGKLALYTFPNLRGLKDIGDGIFMPTEEAGQIEELSIGRDNDKTRLMQGFIENSNMNIVDEMAQLSHINTAMKAQMKVIKLFDSMQEQINSTISRNI